MPQRIIDQQLCVPIQRSLCLLHSDIDKTDKTHEQNQCFDTEQQQISMKTHLVDLLPKKSWLPHSNLFLHHHLFLASVIAASESLETDDEPVRKKHPSSPRYQGHLCGEYHLSSRDEGWSRGGVLWLCFCSVSLLLSSSTSIGRFHSRQCHHSMSQQKWTTSSLLSTTPEEHHRPASMELEHRTGRSIRTLSTRRWWW